MEWITMAYQSLFLMRFSNFLILDSSPWPEAEAAAEEEGATFWGAVVLGRKVT